MITGAFLSALSTPYLWVVLPLLAATGRYWRLHFFYREHAIMLTPHGERLPLKEQAFRRSRVLDVWDDVALRERFNGTPTPPPISPPHL